MYIAKKRMVLALLVACSLILTFGVGPAQAQWKPTKPIEFVIQTSPGGGSDQYARFWIGIIEKYSLSPVPIVPVNKPGGAGAVALTYLWEKKGDPHFISPTLNSIITTPLVQKIPVMYPSEDLTPIALMMIDPFLMWTSPKRFKNFGEFRDYCKSNRITATGTGSKQEDEIQLLIIQHAVGCQSFRYVPESGGGKVAAQVAGEHADINVNQPSEALPHYPERLIPIVAFLPKRAAEFPDAPTHHELGIGGDWGKLLDLETGLHQMRGIIGSPDMQPDAVRWYEDLFEKVFQTDEWKAFMKKGAMSPVFMRSARYKQFLIDFENNHVKVMRDVVGWQLRDDLRKR